MTRLLVPEVFGVMALATVVLLGLQLLSDLGLRQQVIQSSRALDQRFLDSMWTLQIIRGAAISVAGLLAAVALRQIASSSWLPTASSFAAPDLPAIVAVLSLTALIGGFESTKLATASRELALGRLTLIELACQVFAFAVMLGYVFIDRTVWALVAGSIAGSLLRVCLSNVWLIGTTNRVHWDRANVVAMLNFGKWLFLTSILGFLAVNGDRLLLGVLVDPKTLGLYSIAFLFIAALRDLFAKIFGNVAFPALSEVARERPEALRSAYYKFRTPIDAMTLSSGGLLFCAGHLLIDVLYDSRYSEAGRMLEILSISLFEVRFAIAGQCMVALGKPNMLVPIIGLHVAALYGLMPIAFSQFGLDGALWVAGGSVLVSLPLTIYFKFKLRLLDVAYELRALVWLVFGVVLGLLADRLSAAIN